MKQNTGSQYPNWPDLKFHFKGSIPLAKTIMSSNHLVETGSTQLAKISWMFSKQIDHNMHFMNTCMCFIEHFFLVQHIRIFLSTSFTHLTHQISWVQWPPPSTFQPWDGLQVHFQLPRRLAWQPIASRIRLPHRFGGTQKNTFLAIK